MSNLKSTIEAIGHDIGEIKTNQSSLLTTEKAYTLFPTYTNLSAQVIEQNKYMEDPIVTKSQLPTADIEELKNKIKELEKIISELKESIQKQQGGI